MELKRDSIPAALLTAMADLGGIYPIVMVYLDWPNDTLRVHSGAGEITYDGHTWHGVGTLGGINSDGGEQSGLVQSEMAVSLSGILADKISWATDDDIRGRDMEVFFGLTTRPGKGPLVSDPYSVFRGTMERPEFSSSGPDDQGRETTVATVYGVSGVPARADGEVVHSDADQQANYPGDTFFEHTGFATDVEIAPEVWPER